MSEKTIDEPVAFINTDYVYDQSSTEQNSCKNCIDVFVPRSEVVFYVSNDINLNNTNFCFYSFS